MRKFVGGCKRTVLTALQTTRGTLQGVQKPCTDETELNDYAAARTQSNFTRGYYDRFRSLSFGGLRQKLV